MGRLIFIVGGIRSGKSSYAKELAKKLGAKVVFFATAGAVDKEMQRRIKLHRASRPRDWKLVEEGRDIASILLKVKAKYDLALIDCLGLWVANLLADGLRNRQIEARLKDLINAISKSGLTTIVVSNEVGAGLVPANPLGRRFCDLLGWANQMLAKKADQVILMQSGIPIKCKE